MLKNYFKIAVRNLLKNPGYSFINIGGLTIGITCCLLIFQFVAFEYSFDRFNENASTLYRVNQTTVRNGETPNTKANAGWAMGPTLAQEVPEVARFVRLHPEYNNAVIFSPENPDEAFEEEQVFYADSSFFRMFSYPLVSGDPRQALAEPGTIMLSETAAQKYFGSENPMGKPLEVEGWISGTFRVNGIFKQVPENSHLQFDFLLPMIDLLQRSQFSDPTTGWGWANFLTYVQLRPDADLTEVERKFTDVLVRNREEDFRRSNTTAHVNVQPLRDIHLNEDIPAPNTIMGSYRTVYFFLIIGLITLLIALVNYINLTTARAIKRSHEVGVRKAIGAQKGELITQFLCESALTIFAASALAFALSDLLLPVMNDLIGTNLSNAIWTQPDFWVVFLAIFIIATLLAGLYPAFILTSFRPVQVLKGKVATSSIAGVWLRRGLVVFQFAAAITLLAGTAIVYTQLNYMRSMDLGIDLEQIVTVPAPRILSKSTDRVVAVETFLQELHRLPAIRQTATSGTVPGKGFAHRINNLRKATADPSTEVSAAGTYIDTSFVSLYGLELAAGEGVANISYSAPEGEPGPILINETAVQALGFDTPADALGQELSHGRVVGVFKDFNWSSAHEARETTIFYLTPINSQISIKVSTENLPGTIASIEKVYKQLFPGNPFRYAFVDEQFDQQYKNDQRFARLFSVFAVLAIFIACLGLFGLATFTAEQRTKEIGIRKVLGATVTNIVGLLSKDFLALVLAGFVIAVPIAWYMMNRWLQDFAYRIEIGPGIFLLAGGIAMLIAVLTVSWQSIRAALANPAKSLRSE